MLKELIKNKRVYFDGATGTVLQGMGLKAGECPEAWNIEHPDRIIKLHTSYLEAGCDVITANTFGINCEKYDNYEQLIQGALKCASTAVSRYKNKFVAFDMGPTGKLLQPLGELDFSDAVEIFAKNVRAAVKYGADLIIIETMNDSLETKAAVLAAKENSNLPVFVTNVYDQKQTLMTGADPETMVAMLEGLGVDAIGVNCSLGPDKMIDVVKRLVDSASIPVIAMPNAGMPRVVDGKSIFDMTKEQFAYYMVKLAELGATVLGGCCGTTPEFIREMIAATRHLPLMTITKKNTTVVSSYTHSVTVDEPLLIGERINPTGKKKLKEALQNGDINYILGEAVAQSDAGVPILDVNVGVPGIDECAVMEKCIKSIQAICDLPLQIDTSDPKALERAMRIYNGKPLVNSVNGSPESLHTVLPIVKKYGGVVIALTIDQNGIPDNAQGRVDIALNIIKVAAEYGIDKKDIVVDPLAMAVSSDASSATVTLEAIRMLSQMGIKTVLGVSNISFGLPQRDIINTVFFANALACGLSLAIMNPFSQGMMSVYHAHKALNGMDNGFQSYISFASNLTPQVLAPTIKADGASTTGDPLHDAVLKGLKENAVSIAEQMLATTPPLDIINNHIIPALNDIGAAFEAKKAYLPQLLMSADAASEAIEMLKKYIVKVDDSGKEVILATVKGDVHDIGKNIVKVLLESYGFKVYDLGRDVAPQAIVDKVKSTGCKMVGLSALMTTTVPAMEQTIKLLKEQCPDAITMVGGAVLTKDYAASIGAHYYCRDAMDTVRTAKERAQKERSLL